MPPVAKAAPQRKKMNDFQSVKHKVDLYFTAHPEDRMLKWRKEWQATSPARAANVAIGFRTSVMQDTDRYIIARQGVYLWFTVRPPAEEETEEQGLAYQKYLVLRGNRGPAKRKRDDYAQAEDLDA